jgi:hypothetical protein
MTKPHALRAADAAAPTEFALSRIQAEGWNAARKYLAGGDPRDTKKIASLNPHKAPLERARWFTGFNNAVEKL